ncbi:MAG: hypothetical protein B6I28_03050 [Fusobacteriia bacterium 4572_132]|nr:MAG: hypothetical protein B6I28_03050 [Fusobacteriia bacterium 4572_132]
MKNNLTLKVFYENEMIFSSTRNWIHPLFDLEKYLMNNPKLDKSRINLEDKIIGKAAGALIIKMGIKKIKTNIISKLAIDILEKNNVNYEYDILVDKISCKTEEVLERKNDIDEAYKILKERVEK